MLPLASPLPETLQQHAQYNQVACPSLAMPQLHQTWIIGRAYTLLILESLLQEPRR